MKNKDGAKKSIYVFLCSLMGMLLFLILHRLAIFGLMVASSFNPQILGINTITALALDYFTMVLFLILGSWYGIWLGLYWYGVVYEKAEHDGLVHSLSKYSIPHFSSGAVLKNKIENLAEKIQEEVEELEEAGMESLNAGLKRKSAPRRSAVKIRKKK